MNWQPEKIYWIITGNCNLHCSHCYIRTREKTYGEFSNKEALFAIDKLVNIGIKQFFITGGEPFLRKDILNVLQYIYDKGCVISGFDTNATMLSSDIMDFLAEKKIFINISHDGTDFYDKNRGTQFEKRLFDICKMLVTNGVEVHINTIVTPQSIENILLLFDKLIDVGISEWLLFAPFAYGNYVLNYSPLKVETEISLYDKIYKKWIVNNKPFNIRLGDTFDSSKSSVQWKTYVCEYFRDTIALFPDGQITPCCKYIAHPNYRNFPNIFKDDVSSILHSELLLKYKNKLMSEILKENSICNDCGYLVKCNGGCRMDAFLESNDMSSNCKRTCSLMHNTIAYE